LTFGNQKVTFNVTEWFPFSRLTILGLPIAVALVLLPSRNDLSRTTHLEA
jgi:hypothetical protein